MPTGYSLLNMSQVMEILSHVNKRIKGQPSIKLPLNEMFPLVSSASLTDTSGGIHLPSPASQAMVRSFALVYLEMAFERASPEERYVAVRTLVNYHSLILFVYVILITFERHLPYQSILSILSCVLFCVRSVHYCQDSHNGLLLIKPSALG